MLSLADCSLDCAAVGRRVFAVRGNRDSVQAARLWGRRTATHGGDCYALSRAPRCAAVAFDRKTREVSAHGWAVRSVASYLFGRGAGRRNARGLASKIFFYSR